MHARRHVKWLAHIAPELRFRSLRRVGEGAQNSLTAACSISRFFAPLRPSEPGRPGGVRVVRSDMDMPVSPSITDQPMAMACAPGR